MSGPSSARVPERPPARLVRVGSCVALAGFTLTLGVLSVGIEPRVPGPSEPHPRPTRSQLACTSLPSWRSRPWGRTSSATARQRDGLGLPRDRCRRLHPGRRGPVRGVLVAASAGLPSKREVILSLGEAMSTTMFVLLGLALLLFPDGRLPSRRWRKVLWILGAAALFGMAGLGLRGPSPTPKIRGILQPAGCRLGPGAVRRARRARMAVGDDRRPLVRHRDGSPHASACSSSGSPSPRRSSPPRSS